MAAAAVAAKKKPKRKAGVLLGMLSQRAGGRAGMADNAELGGSERSGGRCVAGGAAASLLGVLQGGHHKRAKGSHSRALDSLINKPLAP